MSDKKLFQLQSLSAGGADLVYVARPDGTADGSASFTALAPVLAGVLSPSFAAASHAHSLSDIGGAGALAAKDKVGDGDWAGAALSVAHGGTGATGAAAARTALGLAIGADVQGFNARLADIAAASWAQGDILYFNGSNLVRLGAGTSGQVLRTNGAGANPSWTTPSGGGSTTIVEPQGRLTLSSSAPVMAADATAQSSISYLPYKGKFAPLYDGSAWAMVSFGSGLTMSLDTTNQLAEACYDLFLFDNSGTIAIGAGPAWKTAATITVTIATPAVVSWTGHGLIEGDPVVFTTTGALPTGITAGTTYYVGRSPGANSFNLSTSKANGAAGTFIATSGSQSGVHTATNGTRGRGTGAGTTELEQKDGLWTNKVTITLKNGAGAGVSGIAANRATYLGTVYCTANGQTGMAFRPAGAAGGSNPVLALYNGYNRVATHCLEYDTTSTWNYSAATWRPSNGNVNNRITYLDGLAQSHVDAHFEDACTTGSGIAALIGINRNSTTATPLTSAQMGNASTNNVNVAHVQEFFLPALGVGYVVPMEFALTGANTITGSAGAGRQCHAIRISLDM